MNPTQRPPIASPPDPEIEKIKTVVSILTDFSKHIVVSIFNCIDRRSDPRPSYDLHICRLNGALAVVTCNYIDGMNGKKLKEAATKYLLQEWSADDFVNGLGDQVEEDL